AAVLPTRLDHGRGRDRVDHRRRRLHLGLTALAALGVVGGHVVATAATLLVVLDLGIRGWRHHGGRTTDDLRPRHLWAWAAAAAVAVAAVARADVGTGRTRPAVLLLDSHGLDSHRFDSHRFAILF